MAEESIDLRKEVFNKAQYIKTINTSFDQFGATTINEDLKAQVTVEEFFGLYNSLFYDIPALGETNSHEYLVKTSGEYINFNEVNEEIEALQAEIAQLRSDLLSAQMQNIRTEAKIVDDSQTNEALAVFENELKKANENLIQTNTTLSENTNASQNSPSITGEGSSASTSSGGTSSGGGGGY